MSLPTGQQRILESIEGRLAESDPRLVSLFSIFTRLTLSEAMPWIEQVAVRPVADRLAAIRGGSRRLARRPAARIRTMVLLPAVLTALACTLTIAFGFPGSQRHVPGAKAPAARELVVKSRDLVARSRLCRAMTRMPMPALAAC